MFELEALLGVLFARAARTEAIGAPLVWRVRGQEPGAVVPAVGAAGTTLGRLFRRHAAGRDPISDRPLHLLSLRRGRDGIDLRLAETWEDAARLRPRAVTYKHPPDLAQWVSAAFGKFAPHARAVAALGRVAAKRGSAADMIQPGVSDLNYLAWLAVEVSRLGGPVALVGRPGSAWELTPLPVSQDPHGVTPPVAGFGPAPVGPFVRAGARGGCWIVRQSGPFVVADWDRDRAEQVVPFAIGGRLAVARRDRFFQGAHGHVRDFYLADDPGHFAAAAPPVPRVVFEATAGKYDAAAWTVPCCLTGFDPAAVTALLTTPWAGADGRTGWHPVPAEEQRVLVYHPGTLDGGPRVWAAAAVRPPTAAAGEDVRGLGAGGFWARADLAIRVDDSAALKVNGNFAVADGNTAVVEARERVELRTAARAVVCGTEIELE